MLNLLLYFHYHLSIWESFTLYLHIPILWGDEVELISIKMRDKLQIEIKLNFNPSSYNFTLIVKSPLIYCFQYVWESWFFAYSNISSKIEDNFGSVAKYDSSICSEIYAFSLARWLSEAISWIRAMKGAAEEGI